MSLSHFVTEAKKNTPILKTSTVELKEEPAETRAELKKEMAEISEVEKITDERENVVPTWQQCQYLKSAGERRLCTQYMSFCVKEKCKKEFMETDFFDFKKHLKHGKPIK